MNPVIFEFHVRSPHLMLGGDVSSGATGVWSGRLDPARIGRAADRLAA